MSDTPAWFSRALEWHPAEGSLDLAGAKIHYRYWGDPSDRDVVLVHGGAAHSRWWDHIAPHFAPFGRVVALDLSGHGDSDHRGEYSFDLWSAEVMAVMAATRVRAPTVIGHSLGGHVLLNLLRSDDPITNDVVIVDSPVGSTRAERPPEAMELVQQRRRLYATPDEIISRFRPVPAQSALPFVFDHIARNSIRELDGGWTWKFDGNLFASGARVTADIPTTVGHLAYFRSELGLVGPEVRTIVESAGGVFVEIPGAGHAPMLDEPIAFITGVRALLETWKRA